MFTIEAESLHEQRVLNADNMQNTAIDLRLWQQLIMDQEYQTHRSNMHHQSCAAFMELFNRSLKGNMSLLVQYVSDSLVHHGAVQQVFVILQKIAMNATTHFNSPFKIVMSLADSILTLQETVYLKYWHSLHPTALWEQLFDDLHAVSRTKCNSIEFEAAANKVANTLEIFNVHPDSVSS